MPDLFQFYNVQFFGEDVIDVKLLPCRDPRESHAKGSAFIILPSAKAVNQALRKNRNYLDGSKVNVELPKNRK